ncbi:MAG: hypothetical protein ACFFC3_02775 [Candidatus Odinarchaeota archaeon]
MSQYESNTIITEFEWSSLGKWECTTTKVFLNPEYQKLSKEFIPLLKRSRTEINTPLVSLGDLAKAKE